MATVTRSQRLLISTGAAALGGAALATLLAEHRYPRGCGRNRGGPIGANR
jgi:hypothetical protein